MKISPVCCLVSAVVTAVAHAGPTEDLAAAAGKLSAAPNYAWTMTTAFASSPMPATPSHGVTEKGGYTVVTSSFGGATIQTVIKGEQMVMQNREGDWMTMDEMRQRFAGGGAGARGGGRSGMGMMMGGGGGQMNFSKDVADYVTKITDVKIVDGAIVGALSAEHAALLLIPGGGRGGLSPFTAKNASGSVKFWLNDGALAKYAVNLKGTLTLPNGDEREMDLTTTTEFKNFGTTTVVVPDEAKKKLGL